MKANKAYSVLELSHGATEGDIEEAYREKVKEHHPDTSDDPNATAKFLEIKEAKKVLLSQTSSNQTGTGRNSKQKKSDERPSETHETSKQKTSTNQSGSNRTSSSTSNTSDWRSHRTTQTTSSSYSKSDESDWRSQRTTRTTASSTNNSHSQNETSDSTSTGGSSQDRGHQSTNERGGKNRVSNDTSDKNWRDIFPRKPTERNVIVHLVAVYLYSLFDNFISPRKDREEQLSLSCLSPIIDQTMIIGYMFPEKVRTVLRHAKLETGIVSVIVGVTPAILVTAFYQKLTWVEGSAFVATCTFGYIGWVLFIQETGSTPLSQFTTSPTDIVSPSPWTPLGGIVLLFAFIPFYKVAEFIPKPFYDSLQFFPFLAIYSIPVLFAIEWVYLRLKGDTTRVTVTGFKGQLWTLIGAMILIGFVVHTPPFTIIAPGVLLEQPDIYNPNNDIFLNGIIVSIWSAMWYLFIAGALELVDIGWNRCHTDWHNNLPARIFWNGCVSATVGVIIWSLIPVSSVPKGLPTAFGHLLLLCGLSLYVYGIATEPKDLISSFGR